MSPNKLLGSELLSSVGSTFVFSGKMMSLEKLLESKLLSPFGSKIVLVGEMPSLRKLLSSLGLKFVFVGRLIFLATCLLFCALQKSQIHHDTRAMEENISISKKLRYASKLYLIHSISTQK